MSGLIVIKFGSVQFASYIRDAGFRVGERILAFLKVEGNIHRLREAIRSGNAFLAGEKDDKAYLDLPNTRRKQASLLRREHTTTCPIQRLQLWDSLEYGGYTHLSPLDCDTGSSILYKIAFSTAIDRIAVRCELDRDEDHIFIIDLDEETFSTGTDSEIVGDKVYNASPFRPCEYRLADLPSQSHYRECFRALEKNHRVGPSRPTDVSKTQVDISAVHIQYIVAILRIPVTNLWTWIQSEPTKEFTVNDEQSRLQAVNDCMVFLELGRRDFHTYQDLPPELKLDAPGKPKTTLKDLTKKSGTMSSWVHMVKKRRSTDRRAKLYLGSWMSTHRPSAVRTCLTNYRRQRAGAQLCQIGRPTL